MLKFLKSSVSIFFYLYFCSILCVKDLEYSIYNLNTTFVNQDGQVVKLKDIKGEIKVISMIYTRCKTTCPIIVENMKEIFNTLNREYKERVHFILVSLDSKRDTSESLKRFGIEKNLDFSYWSLLTSSTDDILQFAVSLGIKYKKELDGNYIHTNLILVLDSNGNIKYNHPGLSRELSKVLTIIYNTKD